ERMSGGATGELEGETAAALQGMYRLGALLMATPVMHLLGAPLAWAVFSRKHWLSSDALILLGSGAAYVLSVWNTFAGGGEVFFETATMVLVLFSLGRWLDVRAKSRARGELDVLAPDLMERAARIVGGDEETVSADQLRRGDQIRVRPGESLAADGHVRSGAASVDSSSLTGESQPRAAKVGDELFAGTRVIDGSLVIEVERVSGERLRDEIESLMKAALARPSSHVRIADRVAAILLPLVLVLALAAGSYHAWKQSPLEGLWVALSVVLISCPCALGIAIPLAMWNAIGEAWRRGVLVRGGDVFERLASVRHLFLDKTGTLTDGEFQLEGTLLSAEAATQTAAELLRIAASLEWGSEHPIGRALAREGRKTGKLYEVSEYRSIPGEGVEGVVGGRPYFLGKSREAASELDEKLTPGSTLVELRLNGGPSLARFELSSRPRPEASRVLQELRAMHFHPRVLTGDGESAGAALARELDIAVVSNLNPAQKLEHLERAHEGGVAYVGDGLNDSAALAEADVGIAVCGASPTCLRAADVSMLVPGLDALPDLFQLAKRAVRVARLNLVWAFSYNAVGLSLAVMGRLTPIMAALAMVFSSAAVVIHSRRVVGGAAEQRDRRNDQAGSSERERSD
ncbi:MAG: Cu+-exporting ATPase, partial [Planctomycetota bacterium]